MDTTSSRKEGVVFNKYKKQHTAASLNCSMGSIRVRLPHSDETDGPKWLLRAVNLTFFNCSNKYSSLKVVTSASRLTTAANTFVDVAG